VAVGSGRSVGVFVGTAVGVGVGVAVGSGRGVCVFVGIGVFVGTGVFVGAGLGVGVGIRRIAARPPRTASVPGVVWPCSEDATPPVTSASNTIAAAAFGYINLMCQF